MSRVDLTWPSLERSAGGKKHIISLLMITNILGVLCLYYDLACKGPMFCCSHLKTFAHYKCEYFASVLSVNHHNQDRCSRGRKRRRKWRKRYKGMYGYVVEKNLTFGLKLWKMYGKCRAALICPESRSI